ncbi:hypothetical protein JCM30237_21060 [Halolamina litorea]
METYILVVRETSRHDGIDADLIDDDGLVETTTQLAYGDYDVTAERGDDEGPDRIEERFTVDASSVGIEVEREDGEFVFRAVADGEEAARIEVSDTEWALLQS